MKPKRTKVIPDQTKPKPYCLQDIIDALAETDTRYRILAANNGVCRVASKKASGFVWFDWLPMQIAG